MGGRQRTSLFLGIGEEEERKIGKIEEEERGKSKGKERKRK